MKKSFYLLALFITVLFYSCNDFQKIPDTESGGLYAYAYCFFEDGNYCLEGSFAGCPRGGKLANTCEARVAHVSYCVFDADSLCVIGGGDISDCPGGSKSQNSCPYPMPKDSTLDSLPDGERGYCEFADGSCFPSPYANGSCGKIGTMIDVCYFGEPIAEGEVWNGLCNDVYYDKNMQFCGLDTLKQKYILTDLCDGKEYDVSKFNCIENNVIGYCNIGQTPQQYNDSLSFCVGDKLYDKCGGKQYDPSAQVCLQKTYHSSLVKDSVISKESGLELACGATNLPYNTNEQFCPLGAAEQLSLCGGKAYDINTEFCLNDNVTAKCKAGEREFMEYGPGQACFPGIGIVTKCEENEYLTVDGKCVPMCNGDEYNKETHFCSAGGIYEKCGGQEYRPYNPAAPYTLNQKCENINGSPTILTLCDSKFVKIDEETQYCGGEGTAAALFECGNNNELYNPITQYCNEEGKVTSMPTCGDKNELYDPIEQVCKEGTVFYYGSCEKENDLDPFTHFCATDNNNSNETSVELCNDEIYKYYPKDTTIIQNDGSTLIIIKQEECVNNEIVDVCGGTYIEATASTDFNSADHFCISVNDVFSFNGSNMVAGTYYVPLCGGSPYDVTQQFCYEQVEIGKYCDPANPRIYNPTEAHCGVEANGEVSTAIYLNIKPKDADENEYNAVLIGEQIWMAENLKVEPTGANGATTNSLCYNEEPDNCDIYGKLYDWATAMVLPVECNEETCASQINTPHRGICPNGWHIPTNDEWNKLFRYVDEENVGQGNDIYGIYQSNTADEYLKAKDEWDNGSNASNYYGFSALPGGLRQEGGFHYVGSISYWWSANENNATNAYCYYMSSANDGLAYGNSDYKSNGYSYYVRCVRDYL